MICAIMQPSYLPWSGYFNLIAQADKFVFLDDAQLQKNSWHNRNRLLVNHSPHWITVPVKHKSLGQAIVDTELDNTKSWRDKHIKLIQHTYGKHSYANDVLPICEILMDESVCNLAQLNIKIIKWFLEGLEIHTEIYLSSEMDIKGRRTERLIKILGQLNADTYLSPVGAMEYLQIDNFMNKTTASLKFQEYEPATYEQYGNETFESHLSIVDVLANVGWYAARRYVF